MMPRNNQDKVYDIIGYAPDADPATPGACSTLTNVYRTTRGWRAAPVPKDMSSIVSTVGPGTITDSVMRMDYTPYGSIGNDIGALIINTVGKIYRYSVDYGLSDISRTAGYGTAVSQLQPMDVKTTSAGVFIARGPNIPVQKFAFGGVCTDITGSLSAGVLIESNRFMLAFNAAIPAATYAADRWICSARDDYENWVLSPTTLCATGRLPPDAILGALRLGDDVYAFTLKTTWVGRFVPGSPEVWVWARAPFDMGAMGVLGRMLGVEYKRGIIWLAPEGLMYWDGAQLVNLMDQRLRRWFSENVSTVQMYFDPASIAYDVERDTIWLTFKTLAAGRKTLLIQPETRAWSEWTHQDLTYLASAPDPGPSSSIYAPYTPKLRSVVWSLGSTIVPTVRPVPLDATATPSHTANMVLNDFGGVYTDSELTGLELKFVTPPTTAYAVGLTRNNLEDGLETASPTIARASDGSFHFRQNARWHRADIKLTGDFEVIGYALEATQTGLR